MDTDLPLRAEKSRLRAHYRAIRSSHVARDSLNAADELHRRVEACTARCVAAYVPSAGEPGSIAVLDRLSDRARVIVPITPAKGRDLQWAQYTSADDLVPGPFGLRQPKQPDGSTLTDANCVIVPAVAIGLDGTRLGHGGGYYDRALAGVPSHRVVGVVHDDEVAATLPCGRHDIRVGWLLTPTRYLRLPSHD